MAAKNTLQYFLGPLLKKFFQDMGREPNNLEMLLIRQQAGKLLQDSNKIIQFPQKRSFAEEIEAMKKSGDIVDKDQMIISDKITERDMFKNSNLNKPTQEITEDTGKGFIDFVRRTDPKGADKLQKAENEIKAAIEAANKRAVENLKKKKKKSDEPDDMATGGRAGYQEGGGIESRLEQLGGDVTSAEQLLQELNQRLESAGSSVPEGGGGIGTLATLAGSDQPFNPGMKYQPQPNQPMAQLPGSRPNLTATIDPNFKPQELKAADPNNLIPGANVSNRPTILNEISGFAGETFNQVPEEFKSGYADYMKDKPIRMGGQAMSSVALPDGNRVMFGDTGSAGSFRDYLKSTGFNPASPLGQPLQSPIQSASSQQNLQKALPGLFAKGGRAGYYTGGITDVEPSLDDIGHGSDSLMARTRLMSPGSQATTSTGLNYLLAEDNDNIRVPFSAGGDAGRRAFLKLIAALTGGVAAAKSGILSLGGKEGTKKAVTETIKKSAGSGQPPPYFFRLVEKIKFMGDDTLATQDKAIAKKYKDYVMEEDFAGNIEIIKKGEDLAGNKLEDVYMKYTIDEVPLRSKKGSAKVEEYEEFTARPDMEGKMKDVEPGVPDEVIEEAGNVEAMTLKKADGGRIGFRIGGSPKKFLEKVFGKERFANMIENDPELHRGFLEVVEMFRKKDKEGLKMYMQKFLPHMDDEMIEDFIIGGGGTEGIQGQLIRLGSGRDYAGKLEMMKKADNMRKLDNLDITEEMIRKPNASGGIQTMLGE